MRFKGKEGSTCDSDLNTDSKEIDCSADTVELSTLTAKSVVQDTTNEEELNDTVSAQDDDDLEIPLTQNDQSQKYLKYKPAENQDDDEYAESGDEEIDKADEVTEGMEIAERVEYEETEESQEGDEAGESQESEEAGVEVKKVKKKMKMKMNVKQGNFTYFTYILKQLICRSS